MVGNVGTFQVFSEFSRVSNYILPPFSIFYFSRSSCNCIFSLTHFIPFFTSFIAKIFFLLKHRCTIIPVGKGRSGALTCAHPVDEVK